MIKADFCKDIDKKTFLVMDNSPIHTSETFQDSIPLWKEQGLDIFYLPKYSPELNCIEILWRFIKYEWIELDAYKSWTHLVNYVENVLQNFGADIEQGSERKKPFILRRKLDGIKKLPGRIIKWNRCALSVSSTWA